MKTETTIATAVALVVCIWICGALDVFKGEPEATPPMQNQTVEHAGHRYVLVHDSECCNANVRERPKG